MSADSKLLASNLVNPDPEGLKGSLTELIAAVQKDTLSIFHHQQAAEGNSYTCLLQGGGCQKLLDTRILGTFGSQKHLLRTRSPAQQQLGRQIDGRDSFHWPEVHAWSLSHNSVHSLGELVA